MKIACIGTGWYPQDPGGLEKYVYGMVHALTAVGDSVDLFHTGIASENVANARFISLGSSDSSIVKRSISARRAYSASFNGPYDVINIHFAMNALPLIPFIDHDTPRVVHFHGPWAAEGRVEGGSSANTFVKTILERFVYRRADQFVVLSSAFRDLLSGYGIDPARIHVIPMGINTNFFQSESDRGTARADLGWPVNSKIFFTARRLINRVGLTELLKAAKIVSRSHPNFLLKIAGKGPLQSDLADTILNLGLTNNVELLGFISEENLVRAFQAADVTVLPTQALEGFGTVISESLACGTPVIVTPVGGMPEAVAPLADGLITRSASPDDIAARMDLILRGELTLPNRYACRKYAVDNYDWQSVWQQIRSVFVKSRLEMNGHR